MPKSRRILILGGTHEAYLLAHHLIAQGHDVVSSLAGRTCNPRLPEGRHRIGGFGGIDGLANYIKQHEIALIIDATHPFAFQIHDNARYAATLSAIPLLRLERPIWQRQSGDNWITVDNLDQAASKLPTGSTVFLALGRQHLTPFLKRPDVKLIARMIDKPNHIENTSTFKIILAKPKTLEEEISFLMENHIHLIVSRNAGGEQSYAKIAAARQLGLPVIMINRPKGTPPCDCTTITEIDNQLSRLLPA